MSLVAKGAECRIFNFEKGLHGNRSVARLAGEAFRMEHGSEGLHATSVHGEVALAANPLRFWVACERAIRQVVALLVSACGEWLLAASTEEALQVIGIATCTDDSGVDVLVANDARNDFYVAVLHLNTVRRM